MVSRVWGEVDGVSVITSVDLTGIQRFVFASNRLTDVAGGSDLVEWATSRDLMERVARGEVEGANGRTSPTPVIFATGGNALLRFDVIEQARDFAARYSRLLLEKAPGLEAAIVHVEATEGLVSAMIAAGQRMPAVKAKRLPHAPLLGLGVTAACRETGLPAVVPPTRDRVPLAAGVRARRARASAGLERWDGFLPSGGDWAFPKELDDLGRSWGDRSLIGVVHVDANGVGGKVVDWLNRQAQSGVTDDAVSADFARWSASLSAALQRSLASAVDSVVEAVREVKGRRRIGDEGRLGFDLAKVKGKEQWYLPIRPILLGGDDLTFVCDGRIALDLAAAALSVFPVGDPDDNPTIGACAGVAIVRSHHPFARAYELAEQLCSAAKGRLRVERAEDACALDWQINAPRPGATIDAVRAREYDGGRLTCRPYRLDDPNVSWPWLRDTLIGKTLRDEPWSGSRGKAKDLLAVVKARGGDGVRDALTAWRIVQPAIALPGRLGNDGFQDGYGGRRTPLVDAIELLDIHVPLEPAQVSA